MSILDALIACAGDWHGTSTLQDPGTIQPSPSSSNLTVTPLLGGRFVRLDYTWSYQDKPQEGSLLIGSEKKGSVLTGYWIDTWHVGEKVMTFQGPNPSGSTYSLRGSYEAPPGPDWGWRIEITPEAEGTLRMVMFNIWPESEGGQEDLAVDASYTRA